MNNDSHSYQRDENEIGWKKNRFLQMGTYDLMH